LPFRAPACLIFGMSESFSASAEESIPVRFASATRLRIAESRRLIVEGDCFSIEARHSSINSRESGRPAAKAKR
jgi:hypothetical protein